MRTASSNAALHYRAGQCEQTNIATWNVAAVNNNPFEYWVTHPDPAYNALMDGVQDFIDQAGARDVAVEDVFDSTMADQLFADLRQANVDFVDEVEVLWQTGYRSRKIIQDFLKDPLLGKKRLISVPDRITNTVRDKSGCDVMRPTVINYFSGEMSTKSSWWAAWRKFVFHTKVELCDRAGATLILSLLDPISAVKYPALSADEELLSIPLQVLCLAIFDAILLHILNIVGKDSWPGIRTSLAEAFRTHKDEQVATTVIRYTQNPNPQTPNPEL